MLSTEKTEKMKTIKVKKVRIPCVSYGILTFINASGPFGNAFAASRACYYDLSLALGDTEHRLAGWTFKIAVCFFISLFVFFELDCILRLSF